MVLLRGKARIVLRVMAGGALLAVAVWLGTVGLVLAAGARPNYRSADAILVLGAAQWNGRPSPVLRARIDHALSLYSEGLAPVLLFTGGVGRGDTLSEAEVARRYAIAKGIDIEHILVETDGLTSSESIRAAAAIMREHGLQTAIIVSDSYHMLRVELLARRAGIRPYRAPATGSPIDRARREHWKYVLRESVLFPATVLTGSWQ